MKFTLASNAALLLTILGLASHVDAAGVKPLKIMGGKRALEQLGAVAVQPPRAPIVGPTLDKRVWKKGPDKTKMKCGPGVGSCSPGYCCSIGGHCGKGYHYCSGPACQMNYADSCDSQQKPGGEDTIDIPRPLVGNVTYDGLGIYNCKNENQIALTFDDGPFNFTWHLLDVLASYGAKATFFITGNNMGKGQIDINETGYPAIIRRMVADGHQIAHHGWTHENATTLTEDQFVDQIH